MLIITYLDFASCMSTPTLKKWWVQVVTTVLFY